MSPCPELFLKLIASQEKSSIAVSMKLRYNLVGPKLQGGRLHIGEHKKPVCKSQQCLGMGWTASQGSEPTSTRSMQVEPESGWRNCYFPWEPKGYIKWTLRQASSSCAILFHDSERWSLYPQRIFCLTVSLEYQQATAVFKYLQWP